MSEDRARSAFRIAPRVLAAPGSLVAEAFAGGPAANLFRGVIQPGSVGGVGVYRPGRIGPEAFVATSARARAKLEAILRGDGQLVTTGQQPGLFLGPLYTLYKTATAIQLAAELERSTDRPTLAAFWVAADDHDWDEIGVCRVLGMDDVLTELRLVPPEGRQGRSVGEAVLPATITGQVARLGELAGIRASGGDRADLFDAVREAYRPGETMSGAFMMAMARVFADHDLVLLDSSRPAIRQAAAGLYGEIIRRPADMADAMARGMELVQQAGFPIQLNPPESGMQLFYDDGSARHHVLANPSGFTSGVGNEWSPERLVALLHEQPAAFTPAAALRPVLESWLLPIAVSVLGPGELSYWAQLGPLFQTLNVEMPAVAARDSWLLIESRVDRLLHKLGVDETVVERDSGALRRQILESGRPAGISRALTQLDQEIKTGFANLESAADAELPGLKSAVGKARHGMERVLDDLRRVVDRRVAERESSSVQQLQRLVANLAPAGHAQERMLGAVAFLARHGPDLVDRLVDHADVAGARDQD